MKLSGELDYRIHYDVEHDLFHAQNVFNDEYITPTFIEYVQRLEKENAELEAQIEKMKKYGKLLQDMCTVMGNDPYMVSVGLENRVKVLWDSSEEKDGLKMVEDIENRLLEIKPQDWAEIEKWEIKEK